VSAGSVPHSLEVGVWWLLGVWAAAILLVVLRFAISEWQRKRNVRRGIDALERDLGKERDDCTRR